MLSSQLTHYDSCSKDLFEKPGCTVRHLRAPVSQARPTFILTMEINTTRQEEQCPWFFKAKDQERYEFFAINLMLTCLSNDMSL